MDKKDYRLMLGTILKEIRLNKCYTAYRVAKYGEITIGQVGVVESGETNYTIDTFLGYIRGCDLYTYFAEMSELGKYQQDFKDLIEKGIKNDPGKSELGKYQNF